MTDLRQTVNGAVTKLDYYIAHKLYAKLNINLHAGLPMSAYLSFFSDRETLFRRWRHGGGFWIELFYYLNTK